MSINLPRASSLPDLERVEIAIEYLGIGEGINAKVFTNRYETRVIVSEVLYLCVDVLGVGVGVYFLSLFGEETKE